jgi:hypothetical protein
MLSLVSESLLVFVLSIKRLMLHPGKRVVVELLDTFFSVPSPDAVTPPMAVLPFRRRDFEVTALMRELVRCVGLMKDIPWGRALPPTPACPYLK